LFFLSECNLMFNLYVFTRALQMNNFMYTVLNADIPVIFVVVSALLLVMCAISHSVERSIL